MNRFRNKSNYPRALESEIMETLSPYSCQKISSILASCASVSRIVESTAFCVYEDKKFSIGSVYNSSICVKNDVAVWQPYAEIVACITEKKRAAEVAEELNDIRIIH